LLNPDPDQYFGDKIFKTLIAEFFCDKKPYGNLLLKPLIKDVQAPAKASSPGGRGWDEDPLRSFVPFSREKF
jgi:hypothetical protein